MIYDIFGCHRDKGIKMSCVILYFAHYILHRQMFYQQ